MNIGTTIKNARRKLNMTQEQLAEYLNVSISAVSQWESDKTSPDITIIPSICNLLDISADELLGVDILKKQERSPKNAHIGRWIKMRKNRRFTAPKATKHKKQPKRPTRKHRCS